jgi:glycogen debranching enzyme
MNHSELSSSSEWLEPDGLGGFASGTATGLRTRRYHALLLTATTPPTGRVVLVNGFDAWVETANGVYSISSQCYAPEVIGSDGAQRIEAFGWEPWPHWIYKLEDGTRIELEIFTVKGEPTTCLSWKLLGPRKDVKLHVRPFLSGRDYHSLHKGNPAFRFESEVKPDRVSWQPYANLPGVTALTNGRYAAEPHWYYNFLYEEERARGLDSEEDLAAPGVLSWNLADNKATLLFTTTDNADASLPASVKPVELLNRFRDIEQKRREKFPSRLHRAADAYIVERQTSSPRTSLSSREEESVEADANKLAPRSKTIIAGYPWFTDWGRDTLIALRGLCIATGRLDEAREILLTWAGAVSEGMLPNRFPDQGGQPEFNAVDASLWFVVAVHEFLEASKSVISKTVNSESVPGHRRLNTDPLITDLLTADLLAAVQTILEGYSKGTRYGIRADADGLLACGVPGVQLTWMDAKVGDWVVTPRIGKPVEVQALWLNALWIASQHNVRWKEPLQRGLESFRSRFWNAERRMLYDVIDVNHQPGAVDASFRPNQIFAVGGLPLRLVEDNRAFLIVEAVKDHLWTPLGLRSLAPGEPGYTSHYRGGVRDRDGAYHQGTVWPWLLGAFVDAWTWIHKRTPAALHEARRVYLQPLLDHLEQAGLGHISEITDAEAPYAPRGCPWQAWSVGEALWMDRVVLAEPVKTLRPARPARRSAPSPKLALV